MPRISLFCLLWTMVSITIAQPLPEHLQVSTLVAEVLNRNPDLPAMRAAWQAAKAKVDQERSFDDPVLSYGFAPRTIDRKGLDFGQTAALSLRLPWPGKLALAGQAAELEADAAGNDVESVRLHLIEATRSAFADWYFIHRALEINRDDRKLLKQIRRLAELRYASGSASRQDALQVKVETALLDHRQIVLERRRHKILARLNTLLLRTPDEPLPPPDTLPKTPAVPPLDHLRDLALGRHPALRALAVRRQANQRREALAKRQFFPDLTLRTAYNSLWNDEQKRLSVGASINLPLPGRRRARLDQVRAQGLRLASQWQSQRARILEVLQRRYEEVVESEHVIRLYRKRLLPLAEDNLATARADYASGAGDFVDLLGAEKHLSGVRLQLARSLSEHFRRMAALERLTGGPKDPAVEIFAGEERP
ncbi:MAG: hypothetical protein AXA67_08680 [Methylothermaceae bacteria B42]|nr:MAG: hypothetical protein AXA67_08680 [Methylothermaceae bacteria B42]